jgi:LPXTG-motif cell wall-anchored protein
MLSPSRSLFLSFAVLATVVAPVIQADQWNKKTNITITEPVQVPSCCNADHFVILQPGKYVLALVDSTSDRHIVRVFAEDGVTVMTTILAIPNYRLKPTGNSVFQFWETPAGQPRAMRAWFYPGDNFGQEFAYYKPMSIEIAKVSNAPVPAVMMATEDELKTAPVVIVDPKGDERPVEAIVAVNEQPVQQAPSAPAPQVMAMDHEAQAKLPDTASSYPLFALIGLGSLLVSGSMYLLRKRA